jgi:uncharacterized RDD family membrane protein YckC
MSRSIAPGWYKDPAAPETQRYWDGEQWLGDPIPVDATPPAEPPAAPPPMALSEPVPSGQLPGRWPGWPSPVPGGGHTGAGQPRPGPPAQPGQPGRQGYPGPVIGPGGRLDRKALGLPELKMPAGEVAAPLEHRLGARVVDFLAVTVLAAIANSWLGYQFVREIWPSFRQAFNTQDSQVTTTPRASTLFYAIMFVSLAVWFVYEVLTVARNGQTLGKRLFRIRVIRMDGGRVDLGSSFRRWATMALPNLCIPCGIPLNVIDVLWCTWDRPLSQCVHDKSARTIVVRVRATDGPPPAGGGDGAPPPEGDR